jgi:hypothetical protein
MVTSGFGGATASVFLFFYPVVFAELGTKQKLPAYLK